jgi:DNA-directed RNA polymerase alpha subunit
MKVNIMSESEIRSIVAEEVKRRLHRSADRLMHELEMRVPEPGPKTLRDDEPVHMLGLSVRLANVLNNANIATIGQLCAMPSHAFFKYRNFGKVSFIELQTRLARHGRRLSGA